MLNHTRSRQPLTRRARVCAAAAALIVAAPIAAIAITEPAAEPVMSPAGGDIALVARATVETTAPVTQPPPTRAPRRARTPAPAVATQQAPGSIAGVMSDASGAVLPGVMLTLTDSTTGVVSSRVSDATGSFTFPDLPAGRYTLVAQLPGFASLRVDLALEPGQNLQRRLSMRIGGLQETLTVTCAAGGAALPALSRGVIAFERRAATGRLFVMPQDPPRAQDQTAKPVRVGGQIRAPRQIRKVNPICPRTILAPPEGTVVILEATIGADGYVHDIRSLRPQTPNEFSESAMEAVRQWQYTPTLLNNVEVPVIMTVTVQYRRG